ncbi:MAG: hypothetical protein JNG86_04605 [Verrucomicrobiaceae bacterium]|nr:hypothetical protein [Verrucomicrobiaceae bacterium]
MKRLLWLLPLLVLASCARMFFSGPQLRFVEDDFGPQSLTTPWMGPRTGGMVIVHHGPTSMFEGGRYLNVAEAMRHLSASARRLAPNDPARTRMSATYGRLFHFYRTRRDAMMGAPYANYGRGGMNRALMMPPMPLTL